MVFVSIVIPCRNEEKYISRCLETILSQDYPADRTEVLVVDGMSEDSTREIVEKFKIKNLKLKISLLDNPNKFTPFAFNIGIKAAKGDIIALMGAHAGYATDYISKCVKYLQEYNADNVGGLMKTLPARDTLIGRAIAFSMSHFFGSASKYRLKTAQQNPFETDTVFGGCYKREVFNKVGLFNENLIRSQDLEFNLRLKRAGGKIMLAPDIISYYYPKPTFKEFFLHNFRDGVWAILPFKFTKMPLKLRHYIPLIFVLTLPISFWPYILLSLLFSAQIAFGEKDLRLFFAMPLAFAARHFGYGFGSVWGVVKLLFH